MELKDLNLELFADLENIDKICEAVVNEVNDYIGDVVMFFSHAANIMGVSIDDLYWGETKVTRFALNNGEGEVEVTIDEIMARNIDKRCYMVKVVEI